MEILSGHFNVISDRFGPKFSDVGPTWPCGPCGDCHYSIPVVAAVMIVIGDVAVAELAVVVNDDVFDVDVVAIVVVVEYYYFFIIINYC